MRPQPTSGVSAVLEPGAKGVLVAGKVTRSQFARWDALRVERGLTNSKLVRQAVDEFLDRHAPVEGSSPAA